MTIRTYTPRESEIERRWYIVDAEGQTLGRLATQIATVLRGKHKPTYTPHMDVGDYVIVVNAEKVRVTGGKESKKMYYRHTGYPGGLRARSFDEQMAKDPSRIVEKAVKGMLPSGVRGRAMLRMLKVYAGPSHPHAAQLAAGTGARAKKRAEEGPKVRAPKKGATPASGRLEGALSKYKREDLDAEAQRLGITVQSAWKKQDVVDAIQSRYDAEVEA